MAWTCVLLAGAAAGWCLGVCAGQIASERPPTGWSKIDPQVPYRRPSLLGELPSDPDAWGLDHFQGLAARTPTDTLTLTAQLPAAGKLYLYLNAQTPEQPSGPALLLRRSGEAAALGVSVNPFDGEVPLYCEGDLPAPTAAPYTITVSNDEREWTISVKRDEVGDAWYAETDFLRATIELTSSLAADAVVDLDGLFQE